MLSPTNRLPKKEIKRIAEGGARATSEEFALRYRKTDGVPRFAFVVSSKIDKRATRRNRIRRILSRSVQNVLPRLGGLDGVFFVRKNISGRTQKEAEKLVAGIFIQSHLI